MSAPEDRLPISGLAAIGPEGEQQYQWRILRVRLAYGDEVLELAECPHCLSLVLLSVIVQHVERAHGMFATDMGPAPPGNQVS